MRIVLDTSVLVSALIRPQGVTGQVLKALRDGRFTVVYSVPMLVELVEVLSRPQIQVKYSVRPEDIVALLHLIRLRGEAVNPTRSIYACRDPKDNKFLEAAEAGQANALVSGDADLLDLHECESIPILSVAEFLSRI